MSAQCLARTVKGPQCTNNAKPKEKYCHVHRNKASTVDYNPNEEAETNLQTKKNSLYNPKEEDLNIMDRNIYRIYDTYLRSQTKTFFNGFNVEKSIKSDLLLNYYCLKEYKPFNENEEKVEEIGDIIIGKYFEERQPDNDYFELLTTMQNWRNLIEGNIGLCDVAQYVTTPCVTPGEKGETGKYGFYNTETGLYNLVTKTTYYSLINYVFNHLRLQAALVTLYMFKYCRQKIDLMGLEDVEGGELPHQISEINERLSGTLKIAMKSFNTRKDIKYAGNVDTPCGFDLNLLDKDTSGLPLNNGTIIKKYTQKDIGSPELLDESQQRLITSKKSILTMRKRNIDDLFSGTLNASLDFDYKYSVEELRNIYNLYAALGDRTLFNEQITDEYWKNKEADYDFMKLKNKADMKEKAELFFWQISSENPELCKLLKLFPALSIFGFRVKYFMMLIGDGNNGKSAYLNHFSALLGTTFYKTLNNAALNGGGGGRSGTQHQSQLAPLADSKLGCIDEPEGKLDAPFIKSITGGTKTSIRKAHKSDQTELLLSLIIIACNKDPGFDRKGDVQAITRKIPVKLTAVFLPNINSDKAEESRAQGFKVYEQNEDYANTDINNGGLLFNQEYLNAVFYMLFNEVKEYLENLEKGVKFVDYIPKNIIERQGTEICEQNSWQLVFDYVFDPPDKYEPNILSTEEDHKKKIMENAERYVRGQKPRDRMTKIKILETMRTEIESYDNRNPRLSEGIRTLWLQDVRPMYTNKNGTGSHTPNLSLIEKYLGPVLAAHKLARVQVGGTSKAFSYYPVIPKNSECPPIPKNSEIEEQKAWLNEQERQKTWLNDQLSQPGMVLI